LNVRGFAEQLFEFEGHRHAADTRADYNDFGHDIILPLRKRALFFELLKRAPYSARSAAAQRQFRGHVEAPAML